LGRVGRKILTQSISVDGSVWWCALQLSDLQSREVQAAMRRDSYQLHVSNSSPSAAASSSQLHHYPIMTRLYLSSAGDDARVVRDDARVSRHVPECGDVPCDDVFCDDLDECQTQRQLFHAWAQYRIAQRGIMVCLSVCLMLGYCCKGIVIKLWLCLPIMIA